MFVDESGLLMAPLVRRTWAPRGKTPLLLQKTRSHRKVSAIAGIAASPKGRRLRLFFRLHPNQNISSALCIAFLAQLRHQIRGNIVVLWDRFQAHRSRKMERYLGRNPRIVSFCFPPYAPELNPIEYGWSYLKTNPLANDSPENEILLARRARRYLRRMAKRPNLLRGFIDHARLSFFD